MINDQDPSYVEVINEPFHVEFFRNKYIRLYNASLSPGTVTTFHRHCEDTVYIVHEGGEISTEMFPGSLKSSTSFPRSFGLYKKIMMGIRLLAFGSIQLPGSLFFCIHSKDQPIIHRAIASTKNSCNMELMGVEVFGGNKHGKNIVLNDSNYKREYENDRFSVYKFMLKPGESKNQVFDFPGVMIALNGKAEYKDFNSKQSKHDELKPGTFCWHDTDDARTLENKGGKKFEALIIAIK